MSQRDPLFRPWTFSIGRPILLLAILIIFIAPAAPLRAQLPATQLGSIFPSGANPGKSVEVTIAGVNLDDVKQLHFSHAGITAVQKTREPNPFEKGPQPAPNQYVITVAANVPIGRHEVRALGKYGMSNPRTFVVGDLPEVVETEPNNKKEQATEITMPAAVNARSNVAADVDYYKFKAAAGQRVLVDCQAVRIDSRMDPVVSVFDASGREMGSSRDSRRRDPVVDFSAPTAGEYYIKVVDSLYRGGNDYFYRLSVGVLPQIDFVFPPAGAAGGNRPFTLYGRNLPGGQAAGISIDGRPLQKLSVSVPLPSGAAAQNLALNLFIDPEGGGLDAVEYRVKGPQGLSSPVLIGIALAPPLVEKEPNNSPDKAQKLSLPCEVQGQFYPMGDRDWFEFEAKQGEVYTIEVISQRLGLPTDPNLLLQQVTKAIKKNEAGQEVEEEVVKQLATADNSGNLGAGAEFDTRTDDPAFRFAVPTDGTYRLLVRDSTSAIRSDPRLVYRLAITRQRPDFRLAAVPGDGQGALLLRKGGNVAIPVVAFRRGGFQGDIQVSVTGLPAGVTCPSVSIGAGRGSAALILTAAANAAPASSLIQIVGKAKIGAADVTRTARFGAPVWPLPPRQNNQPLPSGVSRLARSLAVSVSGSETAPVAMQLGAGKVYEISRAGKLTIPYKRSGAFKGKLTAIAFGLPANIDFNARKVLTVNPNGGSVVLALKPNTPVGTYTFSLSGRAEKVSYSRNPEAAKIAAERKKVVDKINADAAAASKTAATAKATAAKAATDTAAAAKAGDVKKTAADQTLAVAQAAAKSAADKVAQAKASAAKTPGDANLAAAVKAAEKVAADAAAKVKTAINAVAAAQTALDDANAKAKAAAEKKVAADKVAAETAARAKIAAELKAATDRLAATTANAAKAKPINIRVVSTPVTIKITPAPITMKVAGPATPLKQGAKLEVPITIVRLYGFNAAVTVSAVLPKGVSGLTIPNAAIAAGQTQTKLVITAAANATDGVHNLVVRVTLKLNNQNLTMDQPITLQVQKVEPPKKTAKK